MRIDYKPYSENNIQFRIESSKALERFKSQQFFVLCEFDSGGYNFSKTSKELAILMVDSVFTWLISVENYLIRSGEKIFTEVHKDYILEKLFEVYDYIEGVAEENRDIFNKEETDTIFEIIQSREPFTTAFMSSLVGEGIASAFVSIVNIIISAIDNFRFELYEADYLVNNGKNPFICITDFMLNVYLDFNHCIALDRYNIYKRRFKIKSITLKNYSSSPVVSSQLICLRERGVEIKNVI